MARAALVERELKRANLVKKYEKKRLALLAIIHSMLSSDDERFAARLQLQKIPRNALPVRQRNRCALTGRPRGTFRKFGIARNKLRELALKGEVPGIIKASW